jgi:hypothetical protein
VGVLLASSIFAAIRLPRATPVMLGLLIASKQYLAPVLLIAVVALSGVRRLVGTSRMVLVSIAIALATVLPFFLLNAKEFINSVILLQLYQPFRPDSISVPGLLARNNLLLVPNWAAFLGAGAVMIAVSRWTPRTPAGFAGSTAVFFFAFFLLSKQAFMNYYFIVFVALLCAVAASVIGMASEAPARSRESAGS